MRLRKNAQRFYFEQRLIYHTIDKYFLYKILYELSGRGFQILICLINVPKRWYKIENNKQSTTETVHNSNQTIVL